MNNWLAGLMGLATMALFFIILIGVLLTLYRIVGAVPMFWVGIIMTLCGSAWLGILTWGRK